MRGTYLAKFVEAGISEADARALLDRILNAPLPEDGEPC